MAKSIYEQVNDGDSFIVKPGVGVKIQCCDCGLTHFFDVIITQEKTVVFTIKRDDRATANIRRAKKRSRKPQ